MPSLLEQFPDCSPHRPQRFIRAVDSYLTQTYRDTELIIISDGCKRTIDIVRQNYNRHTEAGRIKLVELPRHVLFTGAVRQAGIDVASGDVLTNLDTDDTLEPHHLHNIAVSFDIKRYDWCYWNHRTCPDNIKDVDYIYDCQPEMEKICNGNIAWSRNLDVTWKNCNGRKDNQAFIAQLIDKYPNRVKIYGCGYVIRHVLFVK